MPAKRPAELLSKLLETKGLKAGLRRGRALILWPQVAGEILGQISEATDLTDGVLTVSVPDSAAAFHLKYEREKFIARYQQVLPGVVSDIRFKERQLERRAKPKQKPQPRPNLSPDEESSLRKLSQTAPENLQSAILKAGKAVLQKQKADPNPPCIICGKPSLQSPCINCQRLLGSALVEREAVRLARFPLKSRLEGDALQAARYLAQTQLEAQLRDLLPEVVKTPELMPILQDTAGRLLQLQTGERNVMAYRHLLPESLQSLLKEV
ncbi:MAG: DUF721 domain-containing protein [Thermaceae bacterium]|nr:DUF721 domain-containing protein [Thermaceae bacterium]